MYRRLLNLVHNHCFTILEWNNTTSVISKRDTFSPFLTLVILLLLLPNNFMFSGGKSSRKYSLLILNVFLFPILYTYILIEGLSVFSPPFF